MSREIREGSILVARISASSFFVVTRVSDTGKTVWIRPLLWEHREVTRGSWSYFPTRVDEDGVIARRKVRTVNGVQYVKHSYYGILRLWVRPGSRRRFVKQYAR